MCVFLHTGGLIVLVMREEYLWTAEEYKDDQFVNAVQETCDKKKWTVVLKQTFPRHFADKDGIIYVFKVL